mmetsp:Transcript_97470/g.303599  ORF Transcript_97470/g.303599 Transcript_97470/m.303599 type:complete len:637 (+) Transcript_97470:73-1983(+)
MARRAPVFLAVVSQWLQGVAAVRGSTYVSEAEEVNASHFWHGAYLETNVHNIRAHEYLAKRPRVAMALGTLEGVTMTDLGANVDAYFGIEYAKAERFKPAQRARTHWQGVWDASQPGKACPSPTNLKLAGGQLDFMSESCLNLNVYTPRGGEAQKAVLVSFYGGGFVKGYSQDPLFDGSFLAASQDIVVVTVNYRLAMFGNLASAEVAREGNVWEGRDWPATGSMNGLLDGVTALKWIQEHIGAFGGDADRVTIWGESAGGVFVNILGVTPLAKGLFRYGVSASGPGWGIIAPKPPVGLLGCTAELLRCAKVSSVGALRTIPFSKLIACPWNDGCTPSPDGVLQPALDRGDGSDWAGGFGTGAWNFERTLVGYNAFDGGAPMPPFAPKMTQEEAVAAVPTMTWGIWKDSTRCTDVAELMGAHYNASSFFGRWDWALIAMMVDRGHGASMVRMAQLMASKTKATYLYHLGSGHPGGPIPAQAATEAATCKPNWPCVGTPVHYPPNYLGHGAELAAQFGVEGAGPGASGVSMQGLTKHWQNYLGSFVREGEPMDALSAEAWKPLASPTGSNHMSFSPAPHYGKGDEELSAGTPLKFVTNSRVARLFSYSAFGEMGCSLSGAELKQQQDDLLRKIISKK